MKVSGSALCNWSARSFALNTNCCSLMLVAGRQQLPPVPVVAAHLKFDKVPWVWCLSSEVFPARVHYHFCQLSLLCKRALILKEASPSSHVTSPFRSAWWRQLWEFSYNMLQKTAWQSKCSFTNVLACSPSCSPGQLQVYSTLNSHLLNMVLDHEEAVAET